MDRDRWTEGEMVSTADSKGAVEDAKAWALLESTLNASLQEQRRSRRWGIFFKLLTFGYLFALLFMIRAPFGEGVGAAQQRGWRK